MELIFSSGLQHRTQSAACVRARIEMRAGRIASIRAVDVINPRFSTQFGGDQLLRLLQ